MLFTYRSRLVTPFLMSSLHLEEDHFLGLYWIPRFCIFVFKERFHYALLSGLEYAM